MPKFGRLESELRERARELIREHRLPGAAPKHVWAGSGTGLPCSLCGDVVPENEVEYQIGSEPGRVIRFHFMCHAAWQLECVRATPGKAEDPSPGMPM